MGKWKYDKVINVPGAFVVREDMDMAVSDGTEIQCSTIVAAHNADCDAYEAELARVKAESLRVVPVGEPVAVSELHSRQAFTCDHDGVWMIFGCSSWDFSIRNLIDYSETELTENTVVQPVRLERWEATNDHH